MRPLRPRQRGVTPGGKGRFPGFDVLAQVDHWDQETAGVVLARLVPTAELSFFTEAERATVEPLFDLLLDQRKPPKVPVLELVDHRLALDETDGWLYDDLPEDPQAWRLTLALLDRDAQERHGEAFHALDVEEQTELVRAVQDAEQWHDIAGDHVWSLWTRYACSAFYSHPWAWNEIGFGGPAYPRGYQALGVGKLEHWEVPEQRPRPAGRGEDARTGADGGSS
jgi:hypothetical protein